MSNTVDVNKPLILVVDDDLATRLLMRASLEKAGYRVAEAEDGLVAITEFEQLKPDVILLDVMMPKLDGFHTCRAIRKLPGGEHTPILMITGLEDIESIHRSFDSGATDFTTKPINWAILNYRVKYMLRASEAFNDVINKQKQIQKLAFFDQLTGLANRTMFMDTLEISLAKSVEEETQLAVLFLDLDRFKTINDTLGHQAGDILLKNVAERISLSIRDTDPLSRVRNIRPSKKHISRIGGDEFTIMLPNLKNPEDAGLVAKRVNKALQEPFQINDNEVFISASIGISISPFDGSDPEVLMKHADLAMYHAKEKGKNGFQFYKKSLNVRAREQLEFENDVRKAIQNENFTLHYQPQIDMRSGYIVGVEALARWNHEQRGAVSPAKFIPAIEELGLIVPFTDWVISQTGQQRLSWREEGLTTLRIAINISSKQFLQQDIPGKITAMLERYDLNPAFFELELTESVLAQRNDETIAVLRDMHNLGINISVDDFGTGYSSLVYLKTFPVNIVKIDRFFVRDILTSNQDAAIVKAIIVMAQSMGMKTIAEGIEEVAQFELLREMGCDFGQGYLFSPALPAAELAEMVHNNVTFLQQKS